jgi:PAS domain S-box-containing protein
MVDEMAPQQRLAEILAQVRASVADLADKCPDPIKAACRDLDAKFLSLEEAVQETYSFWKKEDFRRRDSRCQILLDATFEGIAITQAGRIIDANKQLAAMLGYEASELVGKEVASLLPPEDRKRILGNILLGKASHIEHKVLRMDGSTITVEARGQDVVFEEGRMVRITALRDITHRKQAEEARRASEERWRLFVEHSPAAIAMFDRKMRYIAATRRWVADYHLGDQNIIGRSHYEVFPEIPEHWKQIHQRCLAGATERSENDSFVRADGTVDWLRWEIVPWHNDRNEIGGVIFFTEVITERLKAEEALRRSEESLKAAQQIAHIGSWEWNIVADTATWSDETYRIFGVPWGMLECHRWNFVQMVHPEDRQSVDQALCDALSGTKAYNLDYRIRRPDGAERIIHAQGEIVRDLDGKPHTLRGIVQDITDRVRAERELRRSRQDMDRAQAVGRMGWWRLDTQRNILTWSPETYRIFGVPDGRLLTYERFLETVHPDDRQYVAVRWAAALQGEPYDIEHRILVDGRVKWVREKAYLEFDNAGRLLGGFGIAQDITDRKQAEQQLQELNETLEARVAQRTAEVQDRAGQLQRLAAELVRVEQHERERLARLLHDNIQQLLVAAKYRATTLRNGLTHPEHVRLLQQTDECLFDRAEQLKSYS